MTARTDIFRLRMVAATSLLAVAVAGTAIAQTPPGLHMDRCDDIVLFRANGAQPGFADWLCFHTRATPTHITGQSDTTLATFGLSVGAPLLGDVNGDGIDDVVIGEDNGQNSRRWVAAHSLVTIGGKVELSDAATSGIASFGGSAGGSLGEFLADINGDGADDLLLLGTSYWWTAALSAPSVGLNDVAISGPIQWGLPGDMPFAGDFNGDGVADACVYRPYPSGGTWHVQLSTTGGLGGGGTTSGQFGGFEDDVPLVGDFNGDGRTDAMIVRDSNRTAASGLLSWVAGFADATGRIDFAAGGGVSNTVQFGLDTDTPFIADINGDGLDDIGVRRDNGAGSWTWYVGFTTANGQLYGGATGDEVQSFGMAPSGGSPDTVLIGDVSLSLAGDADSDADVDLADVAVLQSCFGDLVAGVVCSLLDLNESGSVDLGDWALLARVITGPYVVTEPTLEEILRFAHGSTDGWSESGDPGMWFVEWAPDLFTNTGDPGRYVVNSLRGGESNTGTLTSPVFTITSPFQTFSVAGWDGTQTSTNEGTNNYVRMRRASDGSLLREQHTPGGNILQPYRWTTFDLLGEDVYLEIVDGHNGTGFAWIAFADYIQPAIDDLTTVDDLWGVNIHASATQEVCRTMPFVLAPVSSLATSIPVGASADAVYIAGFINEGWDRGVAHWGEHPEIDPARPDQLSIGDQLGELRINYHEGGVDAIPLVMGVTLWHVHHWSEAPAENKEPFVSRPGLAAVLDENMLLREDSIMGSEETRHHHYYLAVAPRAGHVIDSITLTDTATKRGQPAVWGITLRNPSATAGMQHFGSWPISAGDLVPRIDLNVAGALDLSDEAEAMADALYTSDADLPDPVEPVEFPAGLDAADIMFLDAPGDVQYGDMLTNIWRANLTQIDGKFHASTGFHHETGIDAPWYGGYNGVGGWTDNWGLYYSGAFSRSSDHFATLALRRLNNTDRLTNFVDFADGWLYFYRDNHDPALGPPNGDLDVENYPTDAPPHWSFVMNSPLGLATDPNDLPGNEETDGHGATCVARWVAWRRLGAPTDDWLTAPRSHVYNYSRWDSTRDAADFICWFLDYMGRDVIFCEGETTGWVGDYEPYPTWVCIVALRCSAQMADAIGDSASAAKWRSYADRMQAGMYSELKVGTPGNYMWKQAPYSIYPSFQDSLVHAWFSIYYDGYDATRWDTTLTPITRNTLARQLAQPAGHAQVLAMGYGQGWLAKAALLLDEFDDAGPLLVNLAKYTYDKNTNYVDEASGVDWRKWMWIVPEGTNLMPDGRWHRINDLSNGANQGPALHALEVCAGVDDTDPGDIRIMPRAPEPLTGIAVDNFFVLVPNPAGGLMTATIDYKYEHNTAFAITSDIALPLASVRVGPYSSQGEAESVGANLALPAGATYRTETVGHVRGGDAWWLWIENLVDVTNVQLDLQMP